MQPESKAASKAPFDAESLWGLKDEFTRARWLAKAPLEWLAKQGSSIFKAVETSEAVRFDIESDASPDAWKESSADEPIPEKIARATRAGTANFRWFAARTSRRSRSRGG